MYEAPHAPTGCVYGPWYWDDAYGLSGWYCYSPDSGDVSLWRWVDLTAHGLSADWVPWNTMVHPAGPELLRLAKENAELRASQPSEEDRGWQDQEQEAELVIPTEEEAMDLCARGMAQFMEEIDPDPIQIDADGVEWVTTHECHRFAEDVWLNVYNCYDRGFAWEVFIIGPEHGAKAKGTAPTRAEARRQAVEAARGMG